MFTGDLLAFQSFPANLLPSFAMWPAFPDLRLLRGLRHLPRLTADDVPARRRPGWPAGRATTRGFPRSLLIG